MNRMTEVVVNALRAAPTKSVSEFGLEYDEDELNEIADRLERGEAVIVRRVPVEQVQGKLP